MSALHPPAGGGEERWAERWIAEIQASLPEAPRHERPAAVARLAAMLLACARDEEADAVLLAARREAVRSDDPRELARIEIALAAAALVRDDDATRAARLQSARDVLPELPPSIAGRAWIVEARLARLSGLPVPPRAPGVRVDPDDPIDPDERLELAAELAIERAQRRARRRGSSAAAHAELAKAHEIVEPDWLAASGGGLRARGGLPTPRTSATSSTRASDSAARSSASTTRGSGAAKGGR